MDDRALGGLPTQFADLESLCARWDLADYSARDDRRRATSLDELRVDHAIMIQRGPEILAYLDERPLEALDGGAARLARMMLALPVIGMAVEVFGRTDVADADGLDIRVTAEPVV